jgi:cell division protein FtsZ
MFEQQEFASSAPAEQPQATAPVYQQPVQQATGMRGTLHDGHFIPPKPLIPEPQDAPASTGYGYSAPAQQPQGGYNLRPPVPGASAQQAQAQTQEVAQKKTPSLFERITSGVRRGVEQARQDDDNYDDGNASAATGTGGGGFHTALRAAPRISENPAQGQLNIDAPARAKKEDELDIPAFLRRQAN